MGSVLITPVLISREKVLIMPGTYARQGEAGVKLLPDHIQDACVHVQKRQLMNLDP